MAVKKEGLENVIKHMRNSIIDAPLQKVKQGTKLIEAAQEMLKNIEKATPEKLEQIEKIIEEKFEPFIKGSNVAKTADRKKSEIDQLIDGTHEDLKVELKIGFAQNKDGFMPVSNEQMEEILNDPVKNPRVQTKTSDRKESEIDRLIDGTHQDFNIKPKIRSSEDKDKFISLSNEQLDEIFEMHTTTKVTSKETLSPARSEVVKYFDAIKGVMDTSKAINTLAKNFKSPKSKLSKDEKNIVNKMFKEVDRLTKEFEQQVKIYDPEKTDKILAIKSRLNSYNEVFNNIAARENIQNENKSKNNFSSALKKIIDTVKSLNHGVSNTFKPSKANIDKNMTR